MADTQITSAALQQAGVVLNELATLASQLDRECCFTHGSLIQDRDAEGVHLELDRLRAAICKMGWLADLASEKIGGDVARGGAEAWLLSPAYHGHADNATPTVSPEDHVRVIAQAQGALRAWRVAACDFEFEDHVSDLQVSARAIAELLQDVPELSPGAAEGGLGLVFGRCLVQTAEQALWDASTRQGEYRPDAESMREIVTLALRHLDTYVAAIRQTEATNG